MNEVQMEMCPLGKQQTHREFIHRDMNDIKIKPVAKDFNSLMDFWRLFTERAATVRYEGQRG